jgi:hypothetical protein
MWGRARGGVYIFDRVGAAGGRFFDLHPIVGQYPSGVMVCDAYICYVCVFAQVSARLRGNV